LVEAQALPALQKLQEPPPQAPSPASCSLASQAPSRVAAEGVAVVVAPVFNTDSHDRRRRDRFVRVVTNPSTVAIGTPSASPARCRRA